jgi:predicted RNase H-like HicB family nuclease
MRKIRRPRASRSRPSEERAISRRYCVVFEACPEGVLVSVPALPGCFSFGVTKAEAEARIREAATLYLGTGLADREALPESERVRPMIAATGCRVAFLTFTASPLKPSSRRGGRASASPIPGYEMRRVSRRHLVIRRPLDRRKIVFPRPKRVAAPAIVRRMMNRVLIGDRSFHVPFYQIGETKAIQRPTRTHTEGASPLLDGAGRRDEPNHVPGDGIG